MAQRCYIENEIHLTSTYLYLFIILLPEYVSYPYDLGHRGGQYTWHRGLTYLSGPRAHAVCSVIVVGKCSQQPQDIEPPNYLYYEEHTRLYTTFCQQDDCRRGKLTCAKGGNPGRPGGYRMLLVVL